MRLLRLHSFIAVLSYCLLSGLIEVASAQSVSSTELIQNAAQYDGKGIIYEGEVIGEVMKRNSGAWVNVSDGYNTIGVWVPHDLAAKIKYIGGYKVKGDIVQIRGLFNYACSVHGGDLDIHAESLRIVKSGWQNQENIVK